MPQSRVKICHIHKKMVDWKLSNYIILVLKLPFDALQMSVTLTILALALFYPDPLPDFDRSTPGGMSST